MAQIEIDMKLRVDEMLGISNEYAEAIAADVVQNTPNGTYHEGLTAALHAYKNYRLITCWEMGDDKPVCHVYLSTADLLDSRKSSLLDVFDMARRNIEKQYPHMAE